MILAVQLHCVHCSCNDRRSGPRGRRHWQGRRFDPPFSRLCNLTVLVPGLAVGVSCLHGTGRSGWWPLIMRSPIGATTILRVWRASTGNTASTGHGAIPLAGSRAPGAARAGRCRAASVAVFSVDAGKIASPFAVVFLQKLVCRRQTGFDTFLQSVEEMRFVGDHSVRTGPGA